MQGRELLARRDFAPRRVGNCFRVGYFAPRRVGNCLRVGYFVPRRVGDCFRVGILLRAGWGTAFAWGFCSAQGGELPARGDFAPRRVGNCLRVGILLRAGFRTARAWGFCSASSVTPTEFILLRLFIRGCATAYPCLRSFAPSGLVYQGLRYRLPLPKVFRPVGACLSGIALPLTPA